MSHTEFHTIDSPGIGGTREIVVHGHYGRPVLAFPSEAGSPHDFVANGLLDSVRGAVDEGRIKVFCVPSHDAQSWSANDLPIQDRARAHHRYEDWIIWHVAPFIRANCGGREDIATFGTSLGAFHAVLFALRHPHIFPRALGLSGNYNPSSWRSWGEEGEDSYDLNPIQFLSGLDGAHLDYLRSQLFLTLVVGSGSWEDSTGANPSTRELAHLLGVKQIPHEMHVWGTQWPHDWPSWRAQAAIYLAGLG